MIPPKCQVEDDGLRKFCWMLIIGAAMLGHSGCDSGGEKIEYTNLFGIYCTPETKVAKLHENIDIEVELQIIREFNGVCEIYEKVIRENEGFGFLGKEMTCWLPIEDASSISNNIKDYCSGDLAEAIKELIEDRKNG